MEQWIKKKPNAILASLLAMVLWGSAIPMIKTTYAVMEVAQGDTGAKLLIAGIRFFLGGVLGLLYYFLSRREKEEEVHWGYILALGLVQTSFQYLFYYIGLSNTLGVKASIIQSSNAFIMVILSVLFIKDENLSLKKLLALSLGTLGLIITNRTKGADFSFSLTGEGFILLATIFNGLATVLVRKYGRKQNALLLSGSQFLLGSLPLLALGYFTQDLGLTWSFKAFFLICYGAFISATAFGLWTYVLKNHSASEFSIYKLFIPIFGSIFSVLFLGEVFTLRLALGLGFVLLGSLILNRTK